MVSDIEHFPGNPQPQPGDLINTTDVACDPHTTYLIADEVHGALILHHQDDHPRYWDWAAAVDPGDVATVTRLTADGLSRWEPPHRHHEDPMPTNPMADPERPNELGGPAAFARILGHKDTTTLSAWLKNPPPGFPEPDQWEELPTRRRPLWRRRRMQSFADNPPAARRGAGRPRAPYRFHGDPRLTLARDILAENAHASIPALTAQLKERWTGRTYSDATWREIIRTAREHPQHEEA